MCHTISRGVSVQDAFSAHYKHVELKLIDARLGLLTTVANRCGTSPLSSSTAYPQMAKGSFPGFASDLGHNAISFHSHFA